MPQTFRTLLLVLLFLPGIAKGVNSFDLNQRCQLSMEKVMALRFTEAKELNKKEKSEHPDNLVPYYIDNTIDFITIYISEDEAVFDKLSGNKDARLSKIKSGDPNSPYYLYFQGPGVVPVVTFNTTSSTTPAEMLVE
jgi:hypothetical protein